MTDQAKLADEPLFERNTRGGGYVFVTAPLFSGWSYMLSPNENDNSLYQSLAMFAFAERQAALRSQPVMPSRREGIYIASKTKHAGRWLALRQNGSPIISTWIDEAGEDQSVDLHDLWERCIREASGCRVLIVYRETEDVLKGAWVEIGAALQAGVPVYAVGLENYTIAKYRGIKHFFTIEAAFKAADAIISSPSHEAPVQEPEEQIVTRIKEACAR